MIFKGLFNAVGSWAEKIWGTIRERPEPIREAHEVADLLGIEPAPYALVAEFRQVVGAEGLAQRIADVGLSEHIPQALYRERGIPWQDKFGYEVTISGRDLITGRYARDKRVVTFGHEATPGEIMEAATEWFAAEGEYPQFDITHMGVTGAWIRTGDVPW